MAQVQTNTSSKGISLGGGAKAQPEAAKVTQQSQVPQARVAATPVVVRASRFPDDARIVMKAEGNPKRPGTKAHAAFAYYLSTKAELAKDKKELTVGAFKEALMKKGGQPLRYVTSTLDWDSKHGFIEVLPAKA